MRRRPRAALRLLLLAASFAASSALAAPAHADAPVKLFSRAKDAFSRKDYRTAAVLCFRFLAKSQESADKYESAQFFLAESLNHLGLHHGAVEYYYQVANNRRTPELLPRAVRALEEMVRKRPLDRGLILRDLVGDTDFGDLPSELADFVYYWQGITNLTRGLHDWATERFSKIGRRGYYYFAALYAASVRLLHPDSDRDKKYGAESFAYLFGALDLGAALEALRRRGEADSKLAYAVKALLDEDNAIKVRYSQLPKGWEIELAMLGLARVAAQTKELIARARETDDEELGKPFAYAVSIGGLPVYRRAPRFEERAPSIKAAAARLQAVRAINGQALHALARLLYEQKRFAAAYETLGEIPKHTELGSEILLERAWAKYKAGDAHRAMGLLYALDAPIYRKLFAPEKHVLRGLIYRRFCHFRAAKIAARRFRVLYGDTLEMIREGRDLKRVKRVRQAALRRVHSRDLFLFYRALRREMRLLGDFSDWSKEKLQQHLRQLYRRKRQQVKAELDRSLDQSTREVAEEMLTAEEQVNLLEYEVGQAIFQRVSESGTARARKPAPKVPISSRRVYYPFNGEYWTEELPRYKFNIEDRCVE